MRLPEIKKIPRRHVAPTPVLQSGIGFDVRRNECRRANGREILGVLFVIPQFFTIHSHHFDAEADKSDVVDIRFDMRSGTGKADPAAIGLRRREQSVPEIAGQVVVNDQFAANKAVRLGIAGALEAASREIADQMTTHLVDHGLNVLIFAWLQRLFRQSDVLAAALKIDQCRKYPRHRLPEHGVEGGSQERLLEPALQIQEDLDNPMKEPKEHRAPLLPAPRRLGAGYCWPF